MALEEFLFSAGGGFLFSAVIGYAIKKVMKIAAVVLGLFVAALSYLSYKGLRVHQALTIKTSNHELTSLENAIQNA